MQKTLMAPPPLHVACMYRDEEKVALLITAGADVNAKDRRYKRTSLHWACWVGHNKKVVELLIASGADINAKDESEGGWAV